MNEYSKSWNAHPGINGGEGIVVQYKYEDLLAADLQ
jgi:hypothetical protein